jgi:biopolymer transport protein ExbB
MIKSKLIFLSFIILLLTTSCGFVVEDSILGGRIATRSDVPWWDDDWSYRREITLQASSLSGSLSNVPLSVVLTTGNTDFSHFQSNGDDIRFIDSDLSTELDFEIESFSASGPAVLWVRIPSLPSTNSKKIYLYYGNSTAASTENPTAVWDSDYYSLWHMSPTAALGSGDEIRDATTTGSHGTAQSMSAANIVTGQIGQGIQFNRASNQWIDLDDPDEGYFHDTFTTKTISFWLSSNDTSNIQVVFETGGTTNGIYVGVSSNQIQFSTRDSSSQINVFASNNVSSQFNYFSAVFDNGTLLLYKNGVLANSAASGYAGGEVSSHSGEPGVGYAPDTNAAGTSGNTYLDGILDEIRWSTTARSADWILAQYLSTSGAMAQIGTEEF